MPKESDIPIIAEAEVDLAQQASMPGDDASYHCRDCGLPLEYSGRGRHPVRCKPGEGCREAEVKSAPTSMRRSGDIERIRKGMIELYTAVGFGVSFVDQHDGMIIGTNAVALANSWCSLAETDPKVRKALLKLLTGTSWSGVIFAHAAIAIPIARHHGLIPSIREPKVNAD